jgi:hypothetical protein
MDDVCLRSLAGACQGQAVYGKGDSAAAHFTNARTIFTFYLSNTVSVFRSKDQFEYPPHRSGQKAKIHPQAFLQSFPAIFF